MIGLLRRGDDGLTGWERRALSRRHARRHQTPRALAPSGYVPAPQGTGPDAAAPEAALAHGRLLKASGAACLICGAPAVPGDDLALCQADGGLGPEWADFDEAAWLAGREAC